MKKLCLILLLFSYISVIPAFAANVIVNDTNDRRVPSRSSGPEAFVQYYEVGDDYVETTYYGSNSTHKNGGYRLESYQNHNLPLLKQDFRTELIGTTWDYPDEVQHLQQAEHVQEVANVEANKNHDEDVMGRLHHREAADYYTKDTIKAPNTLIPCGDVEGI